VQTFERLALHSTPELRARALLSLGTRAAFAQDGAEALRFYHEATRFISPSQPLLCLQLYKSQAAVCALYGSSFEAARILEHLHPLATHFRRFEPVSYLDYLNSKALVEAEMGRFDEAEAMARLVASTPAGLVIPGAIDTPREIVELRDRRQRSRGSTVRATAGGGLRLQEMGYALDQGEPSAERCARTDDNRVVRPQVPRWEQALRLREHNDLARLYAECVAPITQMLLEQIAQSKPMIELLPRLKQLEVEALVGVVMEIARMDRRERRRLFVIVKAFLRSDVSDNQRQLAREVMATPTGEALGQGITYMISMARAKHKERALKLAEKEPPLKIEQSQ